MADDTNVKSLDLIGQKGEKQGFFSAIEERVKTFLHIPIKRNKPNIRVKSLYSIDRDQCLDQLSLGEDQLLVSDMYQVLEEEKGKGGELIVPLDMPERSIPPEKLYIFTYCMKLGTRWQKERAEYKEGGCVHGRLTKMDVFCVIADLKPEYSTVGPSGGTFVSAKDDRIQLDFPQNAVKRETKFTITTDCVDRKRFQEYQLLNEAFRCIVGFTNILSVTPSTKLLTQANLRMPLDVSTHEEDCDIIMLHWEKNGDEEDVTVVDIQPLSCISDVYNVPVNSFSGFNAVITKKGKPLEDIYRAVKHAFGKLNLCVIMVFIDYDQARKVNYLLFDCVEFTNTDSVVEFHERNGFVEVKRSRSRTIELKDKAKIKVSIDGSIKQHDKASKINSFNFYMMALTNHVYIPFTVTTGQDCNIRFYWGQQDHKVYFSLETMIGKVPGKTVKAKMAHGRAKGTAEHPKGRKPSDSSRSGRKTSTNAPLQRQGSTYADLHPVLNDKSLAALADSLPLTVWQNAGIELNFTADQVAAICDQADTKKSKPGFELLREWRRKNTGKHQEHLMEELIEAFKELGRNDIVGVIQKARSQLRRISRSDMDVVLSVPSTPTGSVFASTSSSLSYYTDESAESPYPYSDTDQGSLASGLTETPVPGRIATENTEYFTQPEDDFTEVKKVY